MTMSMSTMSKHARYDCKETCEHITTHPHLKDSADYSSLATIIVPLRHSTSRYPDPHLSTRDRTGPGLPNPTAPNCPLRTTLTQRSTYWPSSTARNFDQRPLIDRMVGIGVAAHEGQLFGLQSTSGTCYPALGLILLSLSAIVMCGDDRPDESSEHPFHSHDRASLQPSPHSSSHTDLSSMMGCLSHLVLLIERFVLRRIPGTSRWLGLTRSITRINTTRT